MALRKLNPTILKLVRGLCFAVSKSEFSLRFSLFFADLYALFKAKQNIHLSNDFIEICREKCYEKSLLLLSFLYFCHYVLEIPARISFLVSIYGRDGVIKSSFLRHIEGFKASLQVSKNILKQKATMSDISTYLNKYPNYTLNLIVSVAKPPKEYNARKNYILEFLGHTGGYLVDIGCGVNPYVSDYLERGYFPVGVDISFLSLKASVYLKPSNKGRLIEGVAESLPFRSDSLEVIVASELLEHSLGPDKCLDEFFRCLKPKGRIIASVPIRTQYQHEYRKMDDESTAKFVAQMMRHPYSELLKLEPQQFIRSDDADETHVSFFVPTLKGEEWENARKEAIQSLLQTHGFILVEIKTTPTVVFVAQKPALHPTIMRARIITQHTKE